MLHTVSRLFFSVGVVLDIFASCQLLPHQYRQVNLSMFIVPVNISDSEFAYCRNSCLHSLALAPAVRHGARLAFQEIVKVLKYATDVSGGGDLCWRKLGQWRLERQRFLTRPSTCRWPSHSGRGWGADGVDKVEEPRRNQTLSFSLRSVFFHTLPAFHIFLSLAVSVFCSHIAALRCSAEPVIPVQRSGVWKLQLRSHHPFALLCSPSHLPYPKYPLLYL